jgi:hypothetical protein
VGTTRTSRKNFGAVVLNFDHAVEVAVARTRGGMRVTIQGAPVASTRQTILDALSKIGAPANARQIATVAGVNYEATKKAAQRMLSEGLLAQPCKGHYTLMK